jgi:hypothetical protein
VGDESQPGDTGTTPVEQTGSLSELAEAAKEMAEIADQARALREGLHSLRKGMLAQATNRTGGHPEGVVEHREAAAALGESVQHLSRAVELSSPHPAPVAPPAPPDPDLRLPDGLRVMIGSLRAAGWSVEQVTAYLRRELDVPDAPAAVARAWDHPRGRP